MDTIENREARRCVVDITDHLEHVLSHQRKTYELAFNSEWPQGELQTLAEKALTESLYRLGESRRQQYGNDLHALVSEQFLPHLVDYLGGNRELYEKQLAYTEAHSTMGARVAGAGVGLIAGGIGSAIVLKIGTSILEDFFNLGDGQLYDSAIGDLLCWAGAAVSAVQGWRIGSTHRTVKQRMGMVTEEKDVLGGYTAKMEEKRAAFQPVVDRYAEIVQSYLDHELVQDQHHEERALAATRSAHAKKDLTM